MYEIFTIFIFTHKYLSLSVRDGKITLRKFTGKGYTNRSKNTGKTAKITVKNSLVNLRS